jgi:hypothetical protein
VTILVTWVSAGLAIASLILGAKSPDSHWVFPSIAFWTLAPPVWFFFEYRVLFDNWDDPVALAEFKYMQDLATKVWAGLVATLIALHVGAHPHP